MSTTDQPPAPADVDAAPRPGGGPAPEEGAPDTLEEWLQGLRTDLVTDPAAWLHPEPAPDAASEPLANETAVGPDGGGEAP